MSLDGSVIWIFASISVFLTSNAASMSAIFGFLMDLGIAECTGSLSIMSPFTSSVSSIDEPVFLTV